MPRQGPVVYVNVKKIVGQNALAPKNTTKIIVDPEKRPQNKFDQNAPKASKPRQNPPNHLEKLAFSTQQTVGGGRAVPKRRKQR